MLVSKMTYWYPKTIRTASYTGTISPLMRVQPTDRLPTWLMIRPYTDQNMGFKYDIQILQRHHMVFLQRAVVQSGSCKCLNHSSILEQRSSACANALLPAVSPITHLQVHAIIPTNTYVKLKLKSEVMLPFIHAHASGVHYSIARCGGSTQLPYAPETPALATHHQPGMFGWVMAKPAKRLNME